MTTARDGMLCKIDGRGYVLDVGEMAFGPMDPTRQGVDQGAGAGSSSLSNAVVWRRVRDNWVGGAGQEYADLVDEDDPSSPLRFHTSSNIDPWTRRALTVGRPRKFLHHLPRTVAGFTISDAAGLASLGATDTWIWVQVPPDDYAASPEVATIFENGVVRLILGNQALDSEHLAVYLDTTTGGAYDELLNFGLGTDWGMNGGHVGVWIRQNGADIDVTAHEFNGGYLNTTAGDFTASTVQTIAGKTLGVAAGDAVVTGNRAAMAYGTGITAFGDPAGATASITVEPHVGSAWLTSDTVAGADARTTTGSAFDAAVITATDPVDGSRFGAALPAITINAEYATSVGTTEYDLFCVGGNIVQSCSVDLDTGAITVDAEAILGTSDIVSAVTDGALRVYAVDAAGMIWSASGSPMAGSRLGSELAEGLAYVNGRLLAWLDDALFEVSSGGTATAIDTSVPAQFRWGGAVAAPGGIYAWGRSGVTGIVYLLPISEVDGSIDPGIVAAPFPSGEYVRDMRYHLGVMVLATSKGVRLATVNADGSLSFGPVLEDLGSCSSITSVGTDLYVVSDVAGQVWRLDPARFTDALQPAFASESLTTDDTPTTPAPHVVEIPDRISVQADATDTLVLATSPHLVYGYPRETSGAVTRVCADGTIDMGWFTFGIGEPLAFDSLTVECDPTPAGSSHSLDVAIDTPTQDNVVTATSDLTDPILTVRNDGDLRARRFRVRVTLNSDATVGTTPVVRQIVLRVAPAPDMSDEMLLPILLHDSVETEHGQASAQDVWDEWSHLIGLRDTRQPVSLQIGSYTKTVRVEGLEVRGGGLGGGNGLLGYDRDDDFLAGRWNVRVVTLT